MAFLAKRVPVLLCQANGVKSAQIVDIIENVVGGIVQDLDCFETTTSLSRGHGERQ